VLPVMTVAQAKLGTAPFAPLTLNSWQQFFHHETKYDREVPRGCEIQARSSQHLGEASASCSAWHAKQVDFILVIANNKVMPPQALDCMEWNGGKDTRSPLP
jgi:hypothetical protein